MSKKRKRISRRRLAGQRVMSHVPIFHLGTGQHKPVTYVDLIAEKTVDEKIIKALRKKINIASEVMGDTVQDWI